MKKRRLTVWKSDLNDFEGLRDRLLEWSLMGFIRLVEECRNFWIIETSDCDFTGKPMENNYFLDNLYGYVGLLD